GSSHLYDRIHRVTIAATPPSPAASPFPYTTLFRSTRRAPRVDDHMRIASTAKAFNAAVVLALVDRGALGLDDRLRDRLPRLPAAWGYVTLRQLLNHTSGLPDYSEAPAVLEILTAVPRHSVAYRRPLAFIASD